MGLRWQIQEHCITGIMKLLLLFASIAEQTEVLIAALCPASPDPVMCEKGMNMWWGAMAHCLYPHFIGAGDVCSRLGFCKKRSVLSQPKDWTCEECTAVMERVSAFMIEDETVTEAVSWLQGDCFCGQDGHTAECGDLVSQTIPPAMQVLSKVLSQTTTELCQEVVGVC